MDLILIHGMGRTPLSMLLLKYRLQRLGCRIHLFGYSSTFESLNQVTGRLVHLINRLALKNYGFIGHSLGTAIIRQALPRLQHQPQICFFLAPPILACRTAKFFSRLWLYRVLTGEMGQLLGQDTFMNQLAMPDDVRIYVGTGGPRATWLPLGCDINDSFLTASEARGDFGNQTMTVPALHSFIMNSRAVFKDMATHIERS